MTYSVTLQVSIEVEANSEKEAISQANSELAMTEFSTDRILCVYPAEE